MWLLNTEMLTPHLGSGGGAPPSLLSRRTRSARTVACILLVVGAAGCTRTQPTSEPTGTPNGVSTAPIGSDTEDSVGDLDRLTKSMPCPQSITKRPASRAELRAFHAVAAFTCSDSVKTFPDDSKWSVEIRKATKSGIRPLVHAFDQPSRSATGPACGGPGIAWPPLLLIDSAGDYLVPPEPTDGCGAPLTSVTQALNAVRWKTIAQHKKQLIASGPALAAGCDMQVKNVLYVSSLGGMPPPSSGGAVFTLHPNARLKVCEYHSSAGHMEIGTFTRGMTLDSAASEQLRRSLTGAGPTSNAHCDSQRDFAVITAGDGDHIYLELGGCWRLEREHNGKARIGIANSPQTVTKLLLSSN